MQIGVYRLLSACAGVCTVLGLESAVRAAIVPFETAALSGQAAPNTSMPADTDLRPLNGGKAVIPTLR